MKCKHKPLLAFSMIELIIALLLVSVLGVGAYKFMVSSSRNFQTSTKHDTFMMDMQRVENILKEDLRNTMAVNPIFNPYFLPYDPSLPNAVNMGITPMAGLDVYGNSPTNTADIPLTNAVRLLLPASATQSQTMNTDMDDERGGLVVDSAAIFTLNQFAMISDRENSDVFLITDIVNVHDPIAMLTHDPTNPWNHNGLSKIYFTGAVIRPVQVVTIGLKITPEGNFLVRRNESVATPDNPTSVITPSETILAKNITSMQVIYYSSDPRFNGLQGLTNEVVYFPPKAQPTDPDPPPDYSIRKLISRIAFEIKSNDNVSTFSVNPRNRMNSGEK